MKEKVICDSDIWHFKGEGGWNVFPYWFFFKQNIPTLPPGIFLARWWLTWLLTFTSRCRAWRHIDIIITWSPDYLIKRYPNLIFKNSDFQFCLCLPFWLYCHFIGTCSLHWVSAMMESLVWPKKLSKKSSVTIPMIPLLHWLSARNKFQWNNNKCRKRRHSQK